jgi:hypothetical protein
MRKPDPAELVLSRARRHLSPTAAEAQRVLHRTLAHVAEPALTAAAPQASASPPIVAPAGSLGLKLVAALAIALGSGVTGYVLGRRSVQQERAHSATHIAIESATQRQDAFARAPAAGLVATAAETALPTSGSAPAAAQATEAVSARARGAAVAKTVPHVRSGRASDTTLPEPPSAPRAATLAEELDVMKRVERALREKQPDLALSLLDELDRQHAQGALLEERAAAAAMARCGMGLGDGAALAQAFALAFPESAYRARVDGACRGKNAP